ncbi:hypothetical protein SAMN04488061_0184 [Filomicrobium insigne]|uniref:Lipoprotein n=1 Tax=Filomicrobium insigne TaxID=418854 RepID=A0A1H0GKS5_9HYPH|nr:hypothetical protein [Filomicrobium insigne]SDO07291.1 hypothetical protein SAMN04488061_0184 [Filomicrobium insigne]
MTRTILAIATSLLGISMLFASAAQACISCSYVPEVVNTPSPYQPKAYKQKRADNKSVERRKARPQKRTVTAKPSPEKVDTAKSEPAQTETNTAETKTSTAPANAPNEDNGTQTAASGETSVNCKRFSATAGVTITVPCE